MSDDQLIEESGQLNFPLLHAEVTKRTPDGIEMGVLENGMPYLSQRGLIKMAGIGRTSFQNLTKNWAEEKNTTDIGKGIRKLLDVSGYHEEELFIEIEEDGKTTYAYTEPVCLAVLEYYAFDAKKKSEVAQNSFRTLSKAGFRLFVYEFTGYKPLHTQLDSWKHFHDRVDMTLDAVPVGYFSVFREIASMIVPMIRAGVMISDKSVPDISVGRAWSDHWKKSKLVENYGDRTKYKHEYPLYYPQAKSNPQPAFAYPDNALGVFRKWLRLNYIVNKFPNYMPNQQKKGNITSWAATKAIESLSMPALEDLEKEAGISTFDKSLKKAIDHNPKD